ncbi:MAG TPA: ribosomal RNA small subunit methyltransferase A, partial [Bacteroidetes bacterium]|nr:ribosomal RNA small subunit methyltransferase A [Bacteroidota bacterium]
MIMKIAGSIERSDGGRVIEIGPGTGAITQILFKRFPDL